MPVFRAVVHGIVVHDSRYIRQSFDLEAGLQQDGQAIDTGALEVRLPHPSEVSTLCPCTPGTYNQPEVDIIWVLEGIYYGFF